MDLLTALVVLLTGTPPCNASVFGYEGDEMKGGEAVCLHRDLRPGDIGIAHRDLACGTRVRLRNPRTGKEVVAKVVDHGPYGATWKGHWVLKRKASDRGTWRGCVDLTRKTAKLLGHNGFEPVVVELEEKDAPMVQWQSSILTWWKQRFDSVWGYQEDLSVEGVGRQSAPAQATSSPAGAEWSQLGNN